MNKVISGRNAKKDWNLQKILKRRRKLKIASLIVISIITISIIISIIIQLK